MDELMLNIPTEVENLQLPSPELLTYYKNIKNRIFWIDGEIDDFSLEIARMILQWNKEDEGKETKDRIPIKLFFFSPGGDLDVNNTLIDVIELSKTPVWGVNMGQCASAAAFIYLSCHKRFMLPRSYFLFHQGSGTFSGTFQEVCSQINDYQISIEELMDFMLKHTKYSEEEIEEKIIGEWYVRRDEALKKGVCDDVITNVSTLL